MRLTSRQHLAALQLPGTVWIGSAPSEPIRRLTTGIQCLDSVLDGGLPRGGLCEIVGAPSSGCTAVACALLAASTRRGEVTAVIDLPDALHPAALWAAGTDLDRVLWVRPPSLKTSLKCTETVLGAGGFGLVVLDLGMPTVHHLPLHVWPRLMRVAKQAGTALIVLTHQRVAGSFATMSVTLALQRARWSPRLFEGVMIRAVLGRNRFGMPGRKASIAMNNEQ